MTETEAAERLIAAGAAGVMDVTAGPACPPSEVADTITEWTAADGSLNVAPGDLILVAGEMALITSLERALAPGWWDVVTTDGELRVWAADLVAVRRYITGEAAQ